VARAACRQTAASDPIAERALAHQRRPSGHYAAAAGEAYGKAALDREIAALAATPKGSRNNQLNLVGFRLFQLAAGGELSEGEISQALLRACDANGLLKDDGRRSVLATIRSSKDGMAFPRSRKRGN
jgi:hypothetical protein